MLMAPLLAAISLGVLGSLHCALMCGPLLVAGCSGRPRSSLCYFAGRATSYALLGAVFGEAGRAASARLSFTTIQTVLMLAIAALAAAKGLRLLLGFPKPRLVSIERITRQVAPVFPRRGLSLGLATGVLPCGLLAGGWALAASTGHPLHGAAVMIAFFLATTPGLLGALILAKPVAGLRAITPAWQGALWCALALWIGIRPFLDHGCH